VYKNFKSKRLLIKFLLANSVFQFLKIPLLNNKEKNKVHWILGINDN